jgi:hypothetical protein
MSDDHFLTMQAFAGPSRKRGEQKGQFALEPPNKDKVKYALKPQLNILPECRNCYSRDYLNIWIFESQGRWFDSCQGPKVAFFAAVPG